MQHGRTGVMDGVLGVTVAEAVLREPQAVALAGRREAAGMSPRVGTDAGQAGAPGRHGDQVIDGLAGKRLGTLGDNKLGHRLTHDFCG